MLSFKLQFWCLALQVLTLSIFTQAVKQTRPIGSARVLKQPPRQDNLGLVTPKNPIPRCGEAHNTVTGGIFHKPFEQVVEKERCAWIIGVSGAVGYNVNILHLGSPTNLPDSNQNLVVTGIRHGSINETGHHDAPTMSAYLPLSTGSFVAADSNLLVVTFNSPNYIEGASNGFILEYEAIFTGNISKTSELSSHHVFNSPTFEFTYPPNGGNYTNMELSAFVFPTGLNLKGNLNNVWFEAELDIATCKDTLSFFVFQKLSPGTCDIGVWREYNRVCGETSNQHVSEDDLLLVLFQSDESRTFPGFKFWYIGC